MQECIFFERTRGYRTENPRAVCVPACESRVNPALFAFARWNFLLHAAKKSNNAAKFFVFETK